MYYFIMYKEKYLKYKQKYLRLKALIGGVESQLPNRISTMEYDFLSERNKRLYNKMQIGNKIIYVKNAQLTRQEQIINDPYVVINNDEYYNMPPNKFGFRWIPKEMYRGRPLTYMKI